MNEETKILWIDFLKGLTRSLVQVNLYKSDHPQVMEALDQTLAALAPLASSGEINLTLDNGKLLADGAEFLPADKVPNSIKNVFARSQARTERAEPRAAVSSYLLRSSANLSSMRPPQMKTPRLSARGGV